MTPMLEKVLQAISSKEVPVSWKPYSYNGRCASGGYTTFKRLGPWKADLIQRLDALRAWPTQGVPPVVWLGGLYEPVIFVNALLREEAQRRQISIDALEFGFEVVHGSAGVAAPEAGCYVRGLHLEGASWDLEKGCLADLQPMRLSMAMPLVHFLPTLKNRDRPTHGLATLGVYPCTVHDSPPWADAVRVEPLIQIQLKMPDPPAPGHEAAHWVRRMTALALATPH